eukprot:TRINITY_DN12494_c0_g1_i16.p6 TRINITY_DN12494_c0_g1~~TRINITY_DN12494_c0_g1_i16.p6  ORF type:complete len:139 (+),score=14.48 TRINITY_DN12494_c0_g1_i16:1555-1971(+)
MEFRDTAMRARRNIERDKAQLNASNPLLGGGERVVKQPQSRACAPERGANPLLGGSEGEQNHAKAQRQLKADCRTYASPENKQPGRQDNPPSAIVDTHIPSSPAEDEERVWQHRADVFLIKLQTSKYESSLVARLHLM